MLNLLCPKCKNINVLMKPLSLLRAFSSSGTEIKLIEPSTVEFDEEEERIRQIRDKSRIPYYVRKQFYDEEPSFHFQFRYQLKVLRKFYGRFGKKSRLNPGLCFPSREEMEFFSSYEKLAERPLQEAIADYKKKCEAARDEIQNREEEVAQKLKMLPIWRKEMLDKQRKREEEAQAQVDKRNRVIEEVREVLGYNVSTNDPRFQEALERKELEEKKEKKAARKLKKADRAMKIKQNIDSTKKEETEEEKDE